MAAGDTSICEVCNGLLAELPGGELVHATLECRVPAGYQAPPEPTVDGRGTHTVEILLRRAHE